MPLFDFRCRKCSTVFEHSRPFGAKSSPTCPKCGSKSTEKLLTPPTIQFKGSGFYKTDSQPKVRSEEGKKTETKKPEVMEEAKPVTKKEEPKK